METTGEDPYGVSVSGTGDDGGLPAAPRTFTHTTKSRSVSRAAGPISPFHQPSVG